MSNNEDNNDHKLDCSGGVTSSKKECTSCEQNNNEENITDGINSISIRDDTSKCAACGKEGNSDDMNICNKCKMVKYCNAACKKKHRTKHKKACERRLAELHDEKLFKEMDREECPICFLPMPIDEDQLFFESCCGKVICSGCILWIWKGGGKGKDICAFCRKPPPSSDEENIERVKNLMDNGNGVAFDQFAGYYDVGDYGLPQDYQKANELFLKGGELGCAVAYGNLGNSYYHGRGIEMDTKKAKYYWELAAMGGDIYARHNLGCLEGHAGNERRAYKHWILAARAGHENSLDKVKQGYIDGEVAKEDFASTLRAYHERQKEMKSDARDEAFAERNQEDVEMM